MHQEDGSQLADVTVGDTFNGYQVVAIDLQKPGYTYSRWENSGSQQ